MVKAFPNYKKVTQIDFFGRCLFSYLSRIKARIVVDLKYIYKFSSEVQKMIRLQNIKDTEVGGCMG